MSNLQIIGFIALFLVSCCLLFVSISIFLAAYRLGNVPKLDIFAAFFMMAGAFSGFGLIYKIAPIHIIFIG